MSFSQPRASDLEVIRYARDHASALDIDNLLIQSMARKSESRKEAEDALEKYGLDCGLVYTLQLIREFGPLAIPRSSGQVGRVKR